MNITEYKTKYNIETDDSVEIENPFYSLTARNDGFFITKDDVVTNITIKGVSEGYYQSTINFLNQSGSFATLYIKPLTDPSYTDYVDWVLAEKVEQGYMLMFVTAIGDRLNYTFERESN